MANISDIARMAGVSVSTVSRVLNNHKYVSEEKRAAVQKIMNEMNYTPNKNAVDLIRGETKMIGVIIPYNNNQAFDQMLHGVLNKSVERDYSITVLPTKYNKAKEIEYLAMLKNKLLDGIIITSRSNNWEKIIPYTNYGSVVSCEYTDHPDIGCSYIDRYASYLDVFQYIKSKGHVNVAFTTARGIESISTQQTIGAYKEIFGEINSGYHISHCYSMDDGYDAGQKLLSLRERPTAIYANGDEVAGGIYQYARSIDYEIPKDVAIIGQENQPIGIGLGLSSIDHQLIKVGEQAFDLAVNKSKQKMKIPYHIIHRLSI
ncbi:LacI family DNA-binding transcriptional regulator [Lederbergia lenta]|uniref:Transcriptional repressor of carbon supply (LacI family) protein n=1 Tax=Lederbergia lenta TaxID=1467 RepID=A0A2X4WHW7_LEDLE|nr:LacI family DNA-binding transcriptional regulator [Lederbergia lenta]MCM3109528.1 LacI family DNA-binding transcriptional regulator [Lederbergia lenta]MEC2324718.1 LacI family DNA-binding transcriptional regulator [Lederbergia lenta]SQI58292.1 transcriptional repressor of carbon supply (LacI family) protein [Lederbergia lenta]